MKIRCAGLGWIALVGVGCAGSGALGAEDGCVVEPVVVGSFGVNGFAAHVEVIGSVAYVTTLQGTLNIVDVSDPTGPTALGAFVSPDGFAFALTGFVDPTGVAYMGKTGGNVSLEIVDVSDPANTSLVGGFDTPSGNVFGVDVVGGYAYLCDGVSGLVVADVSEPASATQAGIDLLGGTSNGVDVVGTLAYVAQDQGGLRILDVSDPAAMIVVGEMDTDGVAINVTVHGVGEGALAYVADGPGGMVVVDVSDPTAPVVVGVYATPTAARFVAIEGTIAYVQLDGDEVHVVDVSDPGAMVMLGAFDADADFGNGIAVVDSIVYAPGFSDLLIVDVQLDCTPCPADMNGDGTLNFFDVSAFLSAFGAGDASADFTGDGSLNFFDVSAFLAAFSGGCV